MYKLVLEPEIKSTVISLQVLAAFLISLQRQKWQHRGAQSSRLAEAQACFLSSCLCLLLLRSRALVRCTGVSGWMHSSDSALHVSAVGVGAAVSWRWIWVWRDSHVRLCRPLIAQ